MKRYPGEKSEKILDLRASLIDAIQTSDGMSDGKTDKKALRWQKIEQFLQTHAYIIKRRCAGAVRSVGSDGKPNTDEFSGNRFSYSGTHRWTLAVSTEIDKNSRSDNYGVS